MNDFLFIFQPVFFSLSFLNFDKQFKQNFILEHFKFNIHHFISKEKHMKTFNI